MRHYICNGRRGGTWHSDLRPSEAACRWRRGGRLVVRGGHASRAATVQPAQPRAWPHWNFATRLRCRIGHLHLAGYHRLHLAQLRGAIGCRRPQVGFALRPSHPRSARHGCILPATVVPVPHSRAGMDRLRRAPATPRIRQDNVAHVRQSEKFSSPPGHLPAPSMSRSNQHSAELAARDGSVAVVCKTDRRSAKTAAKLLTAGLTDIGVLRGGTDAWHRGGRPLE